MHNEIVIIDYRLIPIKVPLKQPLYQRNGTIHELTILILELYDASGMVAQGFIYGIGQHGPSILIPYITEELMPEILKRPFVSPDEIWNILWLPRRDKLKGGLCLYAISLIDIACWDMLAKKKKAPLHHLFTYVAPEQIKIYGSGGWLGMSKNDLVKECRKFIESGVGIYKIKVGADNDEERLKLLRDEFGNEIDIAVDANQYFSLENAIIADEMLNKYNIIWFEDPLFSDSIYDLKQLSDRIKTPICVGENFSQPEQFLDVCMFTSADVLQADVIRCGGITPFLKILAIADQYNKKVATHLMPELSISLLSMAHKPVACEFIDMFPDDFFTHSFSIKNGSMSLPEVHGTGVYINPVYLESI